MLIDELKEIARQNGIVGAGGAGFPTHVKLNAKADTVIINGAEGEPLLRVDQQLMDRQAEKLLTARSRGSHSAPLMMTVSALALSFTWVGKPAPPAPTTPALWTWAIKFSDIRRTPSDYRTSRPPTSTHLRRRAKDLAVVSPSPVGPAMVNVVQPSPPTPIPA